jgi:RNA polymerase sigma factor (TIGR02999 family)
MAGDSSEKAPDSASREYASWEEELWPGVYDELRGLARSQLRQTDTLQPTALVHETFLRVFEDHRVTSRGRAYFFAAVAKAMRRILVDHARRRGRQKRGGDARPVTLHTGDVEIDALAVDILDLHRALETLEELEPRQARVVECRYFAGLGVEETAQALEISARSVKRDWAVARAWLHRELSGASAARPGP